MGKAHSHAYRDVGFYFRPRLTPVMDTIVGRSADGVREAAQCLGWERWETDWRRLIDRDDIDLVDIVAPHALHAEMAIMAAKAGKHVLCEKPLAVDPEQAGRMVAAAEESGVVNMVAYNYRFTPAVAFAKRLIGEGVLGRIVHFRARYLQDWAQDPAYPLVWRFRRAEGGGGALADLLAHSVDLARFLVGEIEAVTAMTQTFIPYRPLVAGTGIAPGSKGPVDVDDQVACLARFQCGATGVFEATRIAPGHRNQNVFEINGSLGSIAWDLEHLNRLEFYRSTDPVGRQGFCTIDCTEAEHPYMAAYWPAGHHIGYEHTFINLMSALLDGIASGTAPEPTFRDGWATQCVMAAVEHSAATGRWTAVSSPPPSASVPRPREAGGPARCSAPG
jgi:predicted dehydrogenase